MMSMNIEQITLSEDRVRSIRRGLDMTQQQFADAIGVGKVTVARWESGQRKCRAEYARRVLGFSAKRGTDVLRTTSLFHVKTTDLDALDATTAVEALRDLLWCECTLLGLPRSEVHIGTREIADGGIDAIVPRVPNDLRPSSPLVPGDNYFQIKAGSSWKPWQPSFAKNELLGKKNRLGKAVKKCLSDDGRYVLASFGTDLTPDQRRKSRENIEKIFAEAGYEEVNVDVWGQQELIGLFSRFPSLSLRLSGREDLHFQSWSSWNLSSEMSTSLILGDAQKQFIGEIQRFLCDDKVSHVRVSGEPGLGKTRLVHEALASHDLAPNVVYIRHAEDFQKSRLFNDLLRPDADYFVILVLDECRPRECAEIWERLSKHADRCRVVSIDHDPFDPTDERFVQLECPKLEDEQIRKIIESYTGVGSDGRRWAEFCSGSPRVAHAIGHSLKTNPADMLKSPSMELIWERFVSGYRSLDSAKQKLTVLRHIALFHRFGFEPPVHEEAEFIAGLVRKTDHNITLERFEEIVIELKQQRILQGKTTLFIAPKLLHIHLWRQFWEFHGRSQSINSLTKRLPRSLTDWFVRMFSYAGESRVASDHVKRLLGPEGPFSDHDFALSEAGSHFIHELVNASPEHTLRCLERVITESTHDWLLSFNKGRQQIVRALEKIAMWPDLFYGAAKLLRTLAEAENATDSNNSTGTFVGLFCLAPGGVAPTGATPNERLPTLVETLDADSPETRMLGIKGCETALSVHSGFRTVGPEHQGLKTVPLWTPPTWGEVHEARRQVWDLLLETSRTWDSDMRSNANGVLVESSLGLLGIDSLADRILDTLEVLAQDSATDLKELVKVITYSRRRWRDVFSSAVIERLNAIDAMLSGTRFVERLRRVVHLSSLDDIYDNERKEEHTFRRRLEDLAIEAAKSDTDFQDVLPELVVGTNNVVFQFGHEVARHDGGTHLRATIDRYRSETKPTSVLFLSGYLAAVFATDQEQWERIIDELLRDDAFTNIIGPIIRNSGATDGAIFKLVAEYEAGRLNISCLKSFGYSHFLKNLREETLLVLIDQLCCANEVCSALELLDFVYCQKEQLRPLPQNETLEALRSYAQTGSRRDHADYDWSVVAEQYIEQFPSQQTEIFEAAIQKVISRDWQLDEHNQAYHVISRIIQADPNQCWRIVMAKLESTKDMERFHLVHWLGPGISFGSSVTIGPLALFPMNAVFDWIAENPDERAYEIASIVPKSLAHDEYGEWARELLNRYGDKENVRHGLMSHFWADGWSGLASDHYRRKRDTARDWLDSESSMRVRQWLQEFIDWLSRDIERSEIEEEREF